MKYEFIWAVLDQHCPKGCNMDVQDNLKIIHTVDGAVLSNRYGKSIIASHDVGLISIPSGEIVMADPTRQFEIADFKRKTFQQRVQPGIYPVIAYSAKSQNDCSLAFAEIRFTDQFPATFSAAKTILDAEQSRRRYCGYVVDDAATGFMDGQFFRDACMQPQFSSLHLPIDFDELLEENQDECGLSCAAAISPEGNYSAALFTVPSGIYYWYWGKDKKGKICCLIADFFTFL